MKLLIGIAIFLLLGTEPALSAPLRWTLNDVLLTDGATATGSFVFDADIGYGGYSDIDITGFYGNYQFKDPGYPCDDSYGDVCNEWTYSTSDFLFITVVDPGNHDLPPYDPEYNPAGFYFPDYRKKVELE